jgi:FtsH-binding integral membrane protein
MEEQQNAWGVPVADASPAIRAEFIRKTYVHLGGAVLAFIGLEALLLSSPLAEPLVRTALGTRYGWLAVLGAFVLVGWVAERWARSPSSVSMQYLGLGLYVLAQAIIFVPLMYVAAKMAGPRVIPEAGLYTLLVFTGLTGTVFFTRRDFSWMRGLLMVGAFAGLGVIVASILFGFTLGSVFTVLMVVLAAGYILYYTSNVLHHYPVGSHVAASLALFSAVALLFWYLLRLLSSRR